MKEKEFFWAKWISLLLSIIFIFYQFIIQVIPATSLIEIGKVYSLTNLDVGYLSSIFYYFFSFMIFPAGWMLDQYNQKYVLIVGVILCTLGCFLTGNSTETIVLFIGRGLCGAGGAFAFTGTIKLIAEYFPKEISGVLSGVAVAAAMLGAIFGQDVFSSIIKNDGWQFSLNLLSLFGSILLLSFLVFFVSNSITKDSSNFVLKMKKIHRILKRKENWISALYAALIYIPLPVFAGFWSSIFLVKIYRMEYTNALYVSSFIWFGIAIGSPIIGSVFDKYHNQRRLMSICGFFASFLFFALILGVLKNIFMICLIFFLIGFFCGAYSLSFSLLRQINSTESIGMSVSFVMFMVMLITGAINNIIDFSLKTLGSVNFELNTFDFKLIFMVIPILIAVAALLSFNLPVLVKDTKLMR